MKIWEFIRSYLKKEKRIVFMIVIDNQGSSPGRQGFKMAVAENGEMIGSIGGGIMEHNLVELAKKQFSQKKKCFLKHQTHRADDHSHSSGMICSGNQTIAFYLFDKDNLALIDTIISAEKGQLTYTETGISFSMESESNHEFTLEMNDDKWCFTEYIGCWNRLFVFGGGHVSVALSRLFKQLDFHIGIFDNRNRDIATFKNNEYANSKEIIDYQNAANYVPEGDNIYVVIMSFDHKSDMEVLSQLVNKDVKYIGMMGSQKKVATIFKELISKGISQKNLTKVDAPIGLQIKSQTPAEIAVSIAAKIIEVKNA